VDPESGMENIRIRDGKIYLSQSAWWSGGWGAPPQLSTGCQVPPPPSSSPCSIAAQLSWLSFST
jgi:hypothetical protein